MHQLIWISVSRNINVTLHCFFSFATQLDISKVRGFKLDFDVLKVIYIIWGYLCVMKFMRLFRLSKWIYVLHHTLLHMDFRSEHFRAITILPLLTSSAALYLFFWYDSMNHFSNKLYNPH